MKELRKLIFTASYHAQDGHIPSAFSILDLIWVLYSNTISKEANNQFILSKGQGSLALYAVLAKKKLINESELLNNYCGFNSSFGGHPDRNKCSYIETSTGSLGHGLPMAVGIAMAKKDQGENGNVYCLIGDGESNEGSIWEAVLIATHHSLNNLYCIVDYNHSTDRAVNMGRIDDKFKSFGWQVVEINGHNHQDINMAIKLKSKTSPICIIANTIKGYGCKSIENNPAWHHRAPNNEEYKQFMAEIEES